MRVDVLMPKMGESITEGRILKWLKKPGDAVERDETVLEIATDKVDTEVPSPASGTLVELKHAEGETVEVGAVIAVIETEAGAEQPAAAKPTPRPASAVSSPASAAATVAAPEAAPAGKRFYSPVVMRIAAENNIPMSELAVIAGSGASDRVTKSDILAYLERRSAAPPREAAGEAVPAAQVPAVSAPHSTLSGRGVEVVPMSNMQRLMAEHMVESKRISPHVALAVETDMSAITRFRDTAAEDFKRREGFSLTFMPFIADAAMRALKDFPLVNASVQGSDIVLKHFVNLGIAVAMDDGGLIVPVVKQADTLNITGLARSIADLARRARGRRLQPEEIQDGTFTITNFGVFGSVWGIPIINQPQVAILGVGTLIKRPVVIERDGEDAVAVRPVLTLTLSFDHRIVDGALGGKYLERVKRYLEDFTPPTL